jgi:Co/Zn/Cd efflux system component
MHTRSIDQWQHAHVFLGEHQEQRERRVWLVVALTFVMTVT